MASVTTISRQLADTGWVFVPGNEVTGRMSIPQADWHDFASSWERLSEDPYMADGGRYRQRRHAVLRGAGDKWSRLTGRPHYQSREANPLNGGIERWLSPVEDSTLASVVFRAMIDFCRSGFAVEDNQWLLEVHQFRIEPCRNGEGHPTPEGMHRDGVDWAAIFFIDRQNVDAGVTLIEVDGEVISAFTLATPLDAVLLDDRRVRHAVTPIHRISRDERGHRDVLVLTFANAIHEFITPKVEQSGGA